MRVDFVEIVFIVCDSIPFTVHFTKCYNYNIINYLPLDCKLDNGRLCKVNETFEVYTVDLSLISMSQVFHQ